MQPLVALFFNNFLMKKIGNFCDLFPPQKASPRGEAVTEGD
jgi:hypothetical protein